MDSKKVFFRGSYGYMDKNNQLVIPRYFPQKAIPIDMGASFFFPEKTASCFPAAGNQMVYLV